MVLRIIYHQINNEGTSPLFGGGVDYLSATHYDPKLNAGLFFDDDDSIDTWNEPSQLTGSQHYHRLDSGGAGLFTGGGLGLDGVPGNRPSIAGIFHVEDDYPVVGQVDAFSGS